MLRGEQARRRVGTARAEFNAILRLIRTFKAVNEDWPHVPSAHPLSPFGPPALTLVPRVRVYVRVCSCERVCTDTRAYAPSKTCWYGAYMQPEHLWCSTPNVFYSITISLGL